MARRNQNSFGQLSGHDNKNSANEAGFGAESAAEPALNLGTV